MVCDRNFISYPFLMCFFISPHWQQLVIDLEKGLRLAISVGSFDECFNNNAITKYLFPSSKWKKSLKILIPNDFLPKDTPLNHA